MNDNPIKIRDARNKDKFQIDDIYLNGYAKLCGWKATMAYLCLCRHANFHTQEAFPTIEMMAEKLNLSTRSIIRGIQVLKKYNIIKINREKNDSGQWDKNVYTLLDKSVWISNQVTVGHLENQVTRMTKTQVTNSHTKVTKSINVINIPTVCEANASGEGHSPESTTTKQPIEPLKAKDLKDPNPPGSARLPSPVHALVKRWKVLNGIAEDDKAWDKVHFARCAKSAKLLLEVFGGDYDTAMACCDDVCHGFTRKELSFTLETVLKHAHGWKQRIKPKPKTKDQLKAENRCIYCKPPGYLEKDDEGILRCSSCNASYEPKLQVVTQV